jgi:ribosomal protein S18 acetylase RimI-like enzyme
LIRQATREDLARISELELLLFPENAMTPLMLERELGVSWMFLVGRPAVAYAIVGRDDELLDLLRLGVAPAFHHHGCGAALLKYVLSLQQPVMLTVRKNNAPALRLYRKHGFEVVGHVSAGAEASWVMRWEPASEACPSPLP